MAEWADGVREKVRHYVLERLDTRGIAHVDDDTSLVETGIADSLGIFQLVAFLEEAFGISVGDHEIAISNFGSIDAVVRFVNWKRGPRAPA